MRKSSLQLAQRQIQKYLDQAPHNVYSQAELSEVLAAMRQRWGLAERVGPSEFASFLLSLPGQASEIRITSPTARLDRLGWGNHSAFDVAASIRRDAYFSHSSAIFLHGLTDQVPRVLYVNHEQSAKPRSQSALTQEAIDRAFSRPQRRSKYALTYEAWRFVMLSGKNTGRLGVIQLKSPTGHRVSATNIERTLIDSAVRPVYSGGVYQVLLAYSAARDRFDPTRMMRVMKKLNHVYPYHQALGFYLERAGYRESILAPLRQMTKRFDFYLAHGMRDTSFDKTWRIFYPKDFEGFGLAD